MSRATQKKHWVENYDKTNHWPIFDKKKCRTRCKLPGCTFFTHIFCSKCEHHFCLTSKRNCFYSFHHSHQEKKREQRRRSNKIPVKNGSKTDSKNSLESNGNKENNSRSASSSSDILMVTKNGYKRKLRSNCETDHNSVIKSTKKTKYDECAPSSFASVLPGNEA